MHSNTLYLFTLITLLGLGSLTLAHGDESIIPPTSLLQGGPELAKSLKDQSYNVVLLAATLLIILVVYSIKTKPRKEKIKEFLFWSIAGIAVLSTLYLATSTVYTNTISPTGGPVHWHTDFEIWNCGQKLDLIDPTGLDNKVGSPDIHEHNDDRMHIEGTIFYTEEASFHHFFERVGGTLTETSFTYPTINGPITMPVEGTCNGQPAKLQAYLYRVTDPENAKNWSYTQEKIEYPWNTIMAPYGTVPPGDCLIIEYGEEKAQTEHLCASYRSAHNRGEFNGR